MNDVPEAADGPANAASPSPPPANAAQPPSPPPPTDGGGGNGKGDRGDSPTTRSAAIRDFVSNSAPLIVFTVVALAFVFIIVSIFWPYISPSSKGLDKTLLQLLADTETARGLITFLVAVSTVAIAVILVVYLASSAADVGVVKDRFTFSKEILTSLIGILGTIIGFYFGAAQTQTQGHGTPTALMLENLGIIPLKPGPGGTVMLHATLSIGRSPYHYVIRFKPDTIKEIPGDSPDGTIDTEIIHAYGPATPLDITLEGTDATGAISGKQLHLLATLSPSTLIPSANKPH